MTAANTPNPGDETAWLEVLFARWNPDAGETSVGVDTFLHQFPDVPSKAAAAFRELVKADGKLAGKLAGPATVNDTDAPKRIGRYEVLRELGKGGMGRVYAARDPELGRTVAVKIILGNDVAGDRWDRFRAEAETLARLNHPHIVPIFDTGADGARRFFVMEWAGRGALSSHAGRSNPPREVAQLVVVLARAIAAAHKAGVLHRDLKPHNVLLCDPADEPALNSVWGWPKVADFGLAKEIDAPHDRTAAGVPFGSPAYMAPEQVRGDLPAHGFPTDVYGLGAILFQMLAGRTPFVGTLHEIYHQVLTTAPEPPSVFNSAVSPALDAICLTCLAKDPRDRYGRAEELAAALVRWLQEPDEGAGRTEFRVLVAAAAAVSSEAREHMGESVYQQTVRRIDRFFHDHLKGMKGVRILPDSAGGALASFPSAIEAVRTALALQSAARSTDGSGVCSSGLRIAVHAGDVTELPGPTPETVRPCGLAVDAVLALRGLAQPNQILLTSAVFDESRAAIRETGDTLAWRSYGRYVFAGLPAPVDVNEVGYDGKAPLAIPPDTSTARRSVTPAEEETGVWRPSVGQTLPGRDNWKLAEKVGDGGFGEVWRAVHTKTRDRRVFKFCFDADKLAGLRKEVAFLQVLRSELSDRTDIARIHDWKLKGEPPYFLEIEDVPGGSLVDWAKGRPSGLAGLPLAERLELVARTADALGAAHNIGIIHCDVKPSNILVRPATSGGTPGVVLADFGVSRITDPDLFRKHAVTVARTVTLFRESSGSGTEMYRAPELHTGMQTPTVRSDIYALGVVLYQMAVGDVLRPLAPGWERDVADDLVRADIAACVDGKPEHRPASAGEVARRLRDLPARREAAADEQRKQQRRRVRRRWSFGGAAMLALGYGLAIPFLLWQESTARSRAEFFLGIAQQNEDVAKTAQQSEAVSRKIAEDNSNLAEEKSKLAEHARVKEEHARLKAESAKQEAERAGEQLKEATARALKGEAEAKQQHLRAERLQYAADMNLAQQAFQENRPFRMRELLLRHQNAEPFKSFEWHYLWQLCRTQLILGPRHKKACHAIALSPDGRRAASGGGDGCLIVWDAASGEVKLRIDGHDKTIEAAAFSPDGKLVASASGDRTVKVWNSSTGEKLYTLSHADGCLGSLAFSPDGRYLACAGDDNSIILCAAATGERRGMCLGHSDWVNGVAFSPDSQSLASASDDKTVKLWNVESLKLERTLEGHKGRVVPVAFSPDGKLLASGDMSNALVVWDVTTGKKERSYTDHTLAVTGVAFSPDGQRLASTGGDGTLRIREVGGDKPATVFYGPGGVLFGGSFSRDGTRLALAGDDGSVAIWDQTVDEYAMSAISLIQEDGMFLAQSPDERLLAHGNESEVCLWDPVASQVAKRFTGHQGPVQGVAFSPDGRWLVSGGEDKTARVWRVEDGKELIQFRGHDRLILPVAYDPRGRFVASGDNGGAIKIWDPRTGRELASLNRHGDSILGLAFSRDGRRLASASGDKKLLVWDTDDWTVVRSWPNHRQGINGVAYSPDNSRIAVALTDGTILVYDEHHEEPLVNLRGHHGRAMGLAFSPDGRRLATGGFDFTVHLWDVETGQSVLTLNSGSTTALVFDAGGQRLASLSRGGLALWWTTGTPASGPTPSRWIGWNRSQARAATTAKQWFALMFYSSRLIEIDSAREADYRKVRGVAADELGDWQLLETDMTRLLELEKPTAAVWNYRGQANFALRRYHRAEADQTEALKIDPKYSPAWLQRGETRARLERWQDAIADYTESLKLYDRSAPAWRLRAIARAELRQWEGAVDDFTQALERAPTSGRELGNLAVANLGRGDRPAYRRNCVSMYERLNYSKEPLDWNSLAWTCALTANDGIEPARLVTLMDNAVNAKPKSYPFLNTRGAALYRAGRFEDAIRQLKAAVEVHGKGGSFEDWIFLAMAEFRLGRADGARKSLHEAIELYDRRLKTESGPDRADWSLRVEFRVLREEAEALLRTKP